MTHEPTELELDNLRNWLKERLPTVTQTAPPPSQKLLDMAWQAAKAHRDYQVDNQGYKETLPLPLAASSKEDLPFEISSIGGEWSVTRELTNSQNWQKLKWRCRKECLELYEGRRVIAEIAGQTFDLGEIFDGIAETDIPRDLDLKRDAITIRIEALNTDE